jgi:hypothetical protein
MEKRWWELQKRVEEAVTSHPSGQTSPSIQVLEEQYIPSWSIICCIDVSVMFIRKRHNICLALSWNLAQFKLLSIATLELTSVGN